jgi:hypothetical protein
MFARACRVPNGVSARTSGPVARVSVRAPPRAGLATEQKKPPQAQKSQARPPAAAPAASNKTPQTSSGSHEVDLKSIDFGTATKDQLRALTDQAEKEGRLGRITQVRPHPIGTADFFLVWLFSLFNRLYRV